MPPRPDRLLIFLHSGDYDRMHHGLSIAAAAVAQERPVELYFVWWALERLLDDRLDEPEFGTGREAVADRFEARNLPTLRTLLEYLADSGLCTRVGCTGSLAALGRQAQAQAQAQASETAGQEGASSAAAAGGIQLWLGWSAILQRTAGVPDRFTL